ncbi:MAG: hypothetical protein J6Q82_07565 [Clostridia bacterium]|nr:hypothetical protein [Clostridia bacterium]
MNYKHNINYFKSGDGIKILGAALAIVGAFVFYFGWSYISYILSCIAIPAGLFLFFWSTGRRSNDQDIEEAIEEICSNVKIDWVENKKLSSRRKKSFDPMVVRGYEYEEGVLLKKTKKGSLCSSRYTVAEIAVLEDALYLTTKRFSLIADECEDQTLEIPFSEIRSIELKEEEKRFPYQKTFLRVTDHRLVVRYGDDNLLSFPVNHDLSVEHFVERLQPLYSA